MADSKEGADPSQSSQPALLSGFARAVNAVSSFVGPSLKAAVGTIALGCMGYTVMNKISDFFTSATATEAGKTFTPKQVNHSQRGVSKPVELDDEREPYAQYGVAKGFVQTPHQYQFPSVNIFSS